MLAIRKAAKPRIQPPGRAAERRTIAALSVTGEAAAEESAAPAPPGGGGVARNTAIFSIATGISRVVGLLREIVAASFFGTKGPASAFTIAFQIPNLVSNLFANAALSAAFVPVFTELLQKGRKKEAFRLASTLFWIMLIVLGAVTAFFILGAGVIMPLFTGDTFNGPLNALTVSL
jgi:putative peptidoglycan lipid II flippase